MEIDTSVETRTGELTDITRNRSWRSAAAVDGATDIGITGHTWSPLSDMGLERWPMARGRLQGHLKEAWGEDNET